MKKILIFSLALGMTLAIGGVAAVADEDQPKTRERAVIGAEENSQGKPSHHP